MWWVTEVSVERKGAGGKSVSQERASGSAVRDRRLRCELGFEQSGGATCGHEVDHKTESTWWSPDAPVPLLPRSVKPI